jgi:outer membrane protein
MRNASLVFNVVLLVLVGVLFYLHFSTRSRTVESPVVKSASHPGTGNDNFRIAYFEMDSVEASFAMVKDVTDELNKKEQALTNDLSRMEKALYEKANEYQSKANNMSQTESEAATNDMVQRRRSFESQKERSQQEYQNLSFRKTNEIKQAIRDFLAQYNKTRGYSYIISNEAGFMYYTDTVYNITPDLIKGLNEQYEAKKKKN